MRLGTQYYTGRGAFIEAHTTSRVRYFDLFSECLRKVEVTADSGDRLGLEEALNAVEDLARDAHQAGNRVVLVGNGGSAAIASHLAIDLTKNGGIRAAVLNDAAALTCVSNDFGYEHVFAKQIGWQFARGDVLIAISSSGNSASIHGAAHEAKGVGARAIVTFTGMDPNNLLRRLGSMNFYVPCMEYGLIELTHAALVHSIISVPSQAK